MLSNNFSLAEMNDPIWAGCVACSDAAWRKWLEERGIVNFAWSSQARGFFTDLAGRDKPGTPEIARVWYSEENFPRRDRAVELAGERGVSPLHVALAYVLGAAVPGRPADRSAAPRRARRQPAGAGARA